MNIECQGNLCKHEKSVSRPQPLVPSATKFSRNVNDWLLHSSYDSSNLKTPKEKFLYIFLAPVYFFLRSALSTGLKDSDF